MALLTSQGKRRCIILVKLNTVSCIEEIYTSWKKEYRKRVNYYGMTPGGRIGETRISRRTLGLYVEGYTIQELTLSR